MEGLDLNTMLNRMEIKNKVAEMLNTFETKKGDCPLSVDLSLW